MAAAVCGGAAVACASVYGVATGIKRLEKGIGWGQDDDPPGFATVRLLRLPNPFSNPHTTLPSADHTREQTIVISQYQAIRLATGLSWQAAPKTSRHARHAPFSSAMMGAHPAARRAATRRAALLPPPGTVVPSVFPLALFVCLFVWMDGLVGSVNRRKVISRSIEDPASWASCCWLLWPRGGVHFFFFFFSRRERHGPPATDSGCSPGKRPTNCTTQHQLDHVKP